MQALENEIGGRLLERTSSGVSPTAAGHALAAKIRPVLADYDAAIAEVKRLACGQSEQLRIGYIVSAAQGYLAPALATLRQTHPEVKVKLLDLSPGEQIAALRRGEIDVALIGQEGCLLAQDFYTRKLATLPLLAILPADHALATRKGIQLAELKNERFIGAPESDMPGRNRWLTQLCRRAGFRPKFAGDADSFSHAFTLVASDGVVMLMPEYVRDYPAPAVAMIPIEDAEATWDFLVMWQRGRTAGPVRALLDALPSE